MELTAPFSGISFSGSAAPARNRSIVATTLLLAVLRTREVCAMGLLIGLLTKRWVKIVPSTKVEPTLDRGV